MEFERKKNSAFLTILIVVVFLSVVAIFAVPKFSSAERVDNLDNLNLDEECVVPSFHELLQLNGKGVDEIADYAENWLVETN